MGIVSTSAQEESIQIAFKLVPATERISELTHCWNLDGLLAPWRYSRRAQMPTLFPSPRLLIHLPAAYIANGRKSAPGRSLSAAAPPCNVQNLDSLQLSLAVPADNRIPHRKKISHSGTTTLQ